MTTIPAMANDSGASTPGKAKGNVAMKRKYHGFIEAFSGKNSTDHGPISLDSPEAFLTNNNGFSDKTDFS